MQSRAEVLMQSQSVGGVTVVTTVRQIYHGTQKSIRAASLRLLRTVARVGYLPGTHRVRFMI